MSELVTSIGIPDLVEKLRAGEYLVPRFQREFVWSTADIIDLLHSIIDSRPVGMMTLWEQPDDSGLELEHVSLPENPSDIERGPVAYFGDPDDRTNKSFAVLDGRQRSTAIAMAFGGLRSSSKKKHSGKFFLNVNADESNKRIVFKKLTEVEAEGLDTPAKCISAGLFPFEFDSKFGEDISDQWIKYARDLIDHRFYKDGILPTQDVIDKRAQILDAAVKGIKSTSLAIYIVPKKYDLGTICEIFEKLNTTGTKVSTVDLIHSWVYSDTSSDASGPILLREWMRELGQLPDGAGWSEPDDRPELIAQFVTATYIAEKNPSPPRKVGGRQAPVASVKSADLLATPTQHWRDVIGKTPEFASYIADFQMCVARNRFAMRACPYPISAAIYIGLKWTNKVDGRGWSPDAIDSIYRAFFWRNTLATRYDQGFLTKMAADLKLLSEILDARTASSNFGEWATSASNKLTLNELPIVGEDWLRTKLLDPKPAGALGKALVLPVLTRPSVDLLDPSKSIAFDRAAGQVDVHHLFPRAWVRLNVPGSTLDDWRRDGRGTVEAVANLTPMLSSSNSTWTAKVPGKAIADAGVSPTTHGQVLETHFLSGPSYESLIHPTEGLPEFWERRAAAIATDLHSRTLVQG